MSSDGFEMLIQTFLRRTIVVRGYRQAADDTTVIEALRQANGFRSSVRRLAPAITGMRPSASSSVIITTSHVRHDLR